ncbi:hypothetical protein [uncultured Bacteroides sp.]|uniref:hypothetical protein n=1 Tax=uncultured Bacteroides sp. TaxID=162156 RepID=UPI002AAB3F06|nr:hypothetical protein [uncultured Bacteroides sp.]
MKKPLNLIILSLYCFVLHAQPSIKLYADKYGYQPGDSLYKYQVEYKDPGRVGRELNWDFSNLKILNKNYLIKYFRPDKKDTTKLCGTEHRTRYYYRCKADSIWAIGFENYTTLMNYTKPELKLKFPFTYGDTLYSTFEGKGKYTNLLPLYVKGYSRVEADGEGELKLPNNKKLEQVLRLHSMRYYTETGKDSVEMILDTYTWYTKDIRYPVFESIKTTLHKANKNATVFYTSFYYSPKELKEQSENELENDKDSTDIYGKPIPEAEKVFTEALMLPNPVVNNLEINYKLTRRASIWFSVHNNIGIPMCATIPQTLNEGSHLETIKMEHLITGTYMIFVHVDNMVIKRVIIKK